MISFVPSIHKEFWKQAQIQIRKSPIKSNKCLFYQDCFIVQVTENSALVLIETCSRGSCGVTKTPSFASQRSPSCGVHLILILHGSKALPHDSKMASKESFSHKSWQGAQVLSLADLTRVVCSFLSLHPEGWDVLVDIWPSEFIFWHGE